MIKQIQTVLCLQGSLTTRFSKYHSLFGTLICPFSTKSLLQALTRISSYMVVFPKSQKTAFAEDPLYSIITLYMNNYPSFYYTDCKEFLKKLRVTLIAFIIK
jgi:hypothetical protein